MNTTIIDYTKLIYTVKGKTVPDPYSANHKTTSNFYKRFITQELEYLLANGIEFSSDKVKKQYGKHFDRTTKKLARAALNGGASYGFWNKDHIDMFDIREFKALPDEEDGSIKAGIRFWQLAKNKPLRATLYELDGYTEYKQNDKGSLQIFKPKRAYKLNIVSSEIDGDAIYSGENYPTFPIVPLFGNDEHQSELIGLKTEIDAYDLLKSGFCNDLEDVASVYWLLYNSGGMSEEDIGKFLDQLKRLKATCVDDDGARAEAHTIEVPYNAREVYLTRLENDMYYDAMAMNPKDITAGNVTATAIRAAYDNLEHKANELKGNIEEFIENIAEVAGIEDDKPIFKINRISNETEYNQNVLAAAEYLDHETILKKLTFIEPEEIKGILERTAIEQMDMTEPEEGEPNVQSEESNSEVGATESGD